MVARKNDSQNLAIKVIKITLEHLVIGKYITEKEKNKILDELISKIKFDKKPEIYFDKNL